MGCVGSKPKRVKHSDALPVIAPRTVKAVKIDDDGEDLIKSYITAAVEYRNNHGGKCSLEKQLSMRRVELICVGAFILSNDAEQKYTIKSYDQVLLRNNDKTIRPDLILEDNVSKRIVHVEIDEHGHQGYDIDKEAERQNAVAQHFIEKDYLRIRFNPSIYEDRVLMAKRFTDILMAADGLIDVTSQPPEQPAPKPKE